MCGEELECPICGDNITKSMFITHCGHVYHIKCIETWVDKHKSCPLCRATLYMHIIKRNKNQLIDPLNDHFEFIITTVNLNMLLIGSATTLLEYSL